MDGRMDGRMDGQTDGRTDGRTDGWTDGRTDRWTDGRTNRGNPRGRDPARRCALVPRPKRNHIMTNSVWTIVTLHGRIRTRIYEDHKDLYLASLSE